MRARLEVDQATCRGSGLCYAMAPDLFGSDPSGRGVVAEPELEDADDIAMAQDVIDCCPTEAVRLTVLADD
ncbi:ferredoxin [Saccharothrix sp. HUAS TT1]|uniref:ferredoxin n=1 Tax=unclassified Saccharothrix TaxID=2593673 RepID=UPI00345BB861